MYDVRCTVYELIYELRFGIYDSTKNHKRKTKNLSDVRCQMYDVRTHLRMTSWDLRFNHKR